MPENDAPATPEEIMLASFMRGYSCAIGPTRTADPEEMSNAITAATIVLHVSFEDAADMWFILAGEAMEFCIEHADHIASHGKERRVPKDTRYPNTPAPPTYCVCGHIRIEHPGGFGCNNRDCMGCGLFQKAKRQPEHIPKGRT
jgi:hypothetical protein